MDRNDIKANLIRMRKYFIRVGAGVGECAAWCQLKQEFGVGVSEEADDHWLAEYERQGCVTETHSFRDINQILSGD